LILFLCALLLENIAIAYLVIILASNTIALIPAGLRVAFAVTVVILAIRFYAITALNDILKLAFFANFD